MFRTEINNFYNCFGDYNSIAWYCKRNEIELYIHE